MSPAHRPRAVLVADPAPVVQQMPTSLRLASSPTTRRAVAVALAAAICLVAVLLRVWGIDRFGFNSDEAVYAGQGAAIAELSPLSEFFPIFRAHPLLYQFLVALLYQAGPSDLTPRLLAAAFGIGTVGLTYALGTLLSGRRVGMLAALFLAVMPYHVLVTRQALLDGPMTFFATLALYLLARYGANRRALALYGAAAAMGLTIITKETGILYVAGAYAFFALNAEVRVEGLLRGILAIGIVAVTILPFPLSLLLGGGAETGKSYLTWQLFREPNHGMAFYFEVVPAAVGPLLLGAAALAVWGARRRWTWHEMLLVCWVLAPLVFFQLWPVKGYQYPLPIAVPLCVLAARFLEPMTRRHRRAPGTARRVLEIASVALVAASLLVASLTKLTETSTGQLLAGTGGVPGGREIGEWIATNTPEGSTFMTVGPSMANLVQFYGHRRAWGLSVSPNPLHRNPSYEPVVNPDFAIRNGDIHYLVWDAYSASRSDFFSDGLLRYVDVYNGLVVRSYSVPVRTEGGRTVQKPVILVFKVRPRT